LLGQHAGSAFRAGIVDCYVEPPETRDRTIDKIAHIVFMANIGADELRLRAVAGKGKGRGAADTGQRAGDQNDGEAIGLSFPADGRTE
jgi:hypothetical protein